MWYNSIRKSGGIWTENLRQNGGMKIFLALGFTEKARKEYGNCMEKGWQKYGICTAKLWNATTRPYTADGRKWYVNYRSKHKPLPCDRPTINTPEDISLFHNSFMMMPCGMCKDIWSVESRKVMFIKRSLTKSTYIGAYILNPPMWL